MTVQQIIAQYNDDYSNNADENYECALDTAIAVHAHTLGDIEDNDPVEIAETLTRLLDHYEETHDDYRHDVRNAMNDRMTELGYREVSGQHGKFELAE